MTRSPKQQMEKQLSTLLTESDASAEDREFVNMCRAWLQQESNRDGRGTKAKAIRDVYYATVHFRQARGARTHTDSSIKRTAEKAVTAVRHENFPQFQSRLSRLHGRISKAGKRISEERQRDAERVLELDEEFELRELRSVASLQRIGRALGNCVARKSQAQEHLRDEDTAMWALVARGQQRPLYLLKLDTSTKEVDELEGEDGSATQLERHLALKVLKTLDVSGDRLRAFAQAGAFRAFLVEGQPDVEPIEAGGRRHWVWSFRGGDEIVIATGTPSGRRKHWSRFLRPDPGNDDHRIAWRQPNGFDGGRWNHLSEGELALLVVDHPPFAERLREGASKGD